MATSFISPGNILRTVSPTGGLFFNNRPRMPQRLLVTDTTHPTRTLTGTDVTQIILSGGILFNDSGDTEDWTWPAAVDMGTSLLGLLPAGETVVPVGKSWTFIFSNLGECPGSWLAGAGGTIDVATPDKGESMILNLLWTGAATYGITSTDASCGAPP